MAAALTRLSGTQVPLLGQVPLDVRLREGGDAGVPLVLGEPDSPPRWRCARSPMTWAPAGAAWPGATSA